MFSSLPLQVSLQPKKKKEKSCLLRPTSKRLKKEVEVMTDNADIVKSESREGHTDVSAHILFVCNPPFLKVMLKLCLCASAAELSFDQHYVPSTTCLICLSYNLLEEALMMKRKHHCWLCSGFD